MAGPGNNPVVNLPTIDGGCRYTAFTWPFRGRPEGKVPCLGIGATIPREIAGAKGEIRGIYFQKVDTGNVKAALRVDSFLPVRWADAPTQPRAPHAAGHRALGRVRDLNNRLDLGQIPANDVRPQWQEFTDAMALVKGAMLNRMMPVVAGGQQPQQPQYLLDGFHEGNWRGAPENDITLTSKGVMLHQILTDIGARANWNPIIDNWISSLCGGLYDPEESFRDVFQYLLPNCQSREQALKRVVSATRNGGIEDGAIRCLIYGYQELQLERSNRGRQRNRDLEYRFLLEKKPGEKSRSRSRSPSSSEDEEDLSNNVYDPQNPRRNVVRLNALLSDPDRYFVKPKKLHVYFESHKPDLLLVKEDIAPDTDFPGCMKTECEVKAAIEISSYKKNPNVLTEHIKKNVEQCVQSCLAAFACNQDLMYGLLVVVDGFVLIKVQKQIQGGQEEYNISETDLIMWDDPDSLNALFSSLNGVL